MQKLVKKVMVAALLLTAASGFAAEEKAESGKARPPVVLVAEGCSTNAFGFVKARRLIVDTLASAGFLPLVMPNVAQPEFLDEAIRRADALMIWGSIEDGPFWPRTEFEKKLILRAAEKKIPVLGFCHGMQAINISFGGTHKGVPPNAAVKVEHWYDVSPFVKDCFHEVDVKPGSRVAAAIGEGKQTVNSSHHACIDRVAEGFDVTVRAPDGVVEAIEHRTLPITGLQFHPERLAAKDPRFLNLIRSALTK